MTVLSSDNFTTLELNKILLRVGLRITVRILVPGLFSHCLPTRAEMIALLRVFYIQHWLLRKYRWLSCFKGFMMPRQSFRTTFYERLTPLTFVSLTCNEDTGRYEDIGTEILRFSSVEVAATNES